MQESIEELAHAWESVIYQNNSGVKIDLFLIQYTENLFLEPSIEKLVVGVHGDWVSHAEDLVDKYLLHKGSHHHYKGWC